VCQPSSFFEELFGPRPGHGMLFASIRPSFFDEFFLHYFFFFPGFLGSWREKKMKEKRRDKHEKMTCRRSTLTTRDNELCKDSYWAVRDIARDLSALSENAHTHAWLIADATSAIFGAGCWRQLAVSTWALAVAADGNLWRRFSTEAMLSLANDSTVCKQVPFTGAQHWAKGGGETPPPPPFAGRAWNAYKRTRLTFMTQLLTGIKKNSAWETAAAGGSEERPWIAGPVGAFLCYKSVATCAG